MKNIKFRNFHLFFVWLYVISLFNDLVGVDFGVSLGLHQIISIIYFPSLIKELFRNRQLNNILKYFILEWKYLVLLTIIFGVLIPWEYKDQYRSVTQRAFGRSFISLFRILLEFLSIIVPLFWIKYKIVRIDKLFKIISYVIIFTLIAAIVDVLIGYKIRAIIPGARIIEGRFMALNGEPRVFGSVMLFANILFYYLKNRYNVKLYKLVYFLTFIGIILSGSASTILSLVAVVFVINIMFSKINKIILFPVGVLLLLLLNIGSVSSIIVDNNFISENTMYKIESVLGTNKEILVEKSTVNNEPQLFQRFEVFDRAALNFLWNNPIYIFTGTGPNLISIPSSAYIDAYSKSIYEEVINSVPHTYLINVISRSGLFGVFSIVILFFFNFKKKLQFLKLKELLIMFYKIFAVNIILSSSLFYFILGIIILTYLIKLNDYNSNTHTKFSCVY